MEKKCGRCKITKSSDSFYKCKATKDGLQGLCKQCSAADIRMRQRRRTKTQGDTRNFNTLFLHLKKEDWCETYEMLSLMGYDVNSDIHLQFIQRHPQLVYKSQTEVLKNWCPASDCS